MTPLCWRTYFSPHALFDVTVPQVFHVSLAKNSLAFIRFGRPRLVCRLLAEERGKATTETAAAAEAAQAAAAAAAAAAAQAGKELRHRGVVSLSNVGRAR